MSNLRYPWETPRSVIRIRRSDGPHQRQLELFLEQFSNGRSGDQLIWDRYFEKWGSAPAATPAVFIKAAGPSRMERELSDDQIEALKAKAAADLQANRRELGESVSADELEERAAQVLVDLQAFARSMGLTEVEPIPPERRTKPMSYRKAAKYLGKGDSQDAAEWVKSCVKDGTLRCEDLSRQAHIFDGDQFPAESHQYIRPKST